MYPVSTPHITVPLASSTTASLTPNSSTLTNSQIQSISSQSSTTSNESGTPDAVSLVSLHTSATRQVPPVIERISVSSISPPPPPHPPLAITREAPQLTNLTSRIYEETSPRSLRRVKGSISALTIKTESHHLPTTSTEAHQAITSPSDRRNETKSTLPAQQKSPQKISNVKPRAHWVEDEKSPDALSPKTGKGKQVATQEESTTVEDLRPSQQKKSSSSKDGRPRHVEGHKQQYSSGKQDKSKKGS